MTVFYRKYRPQKFADLVGQEKIKEILLAQLSSGKISHGYLFAGPRGTGKTSTARIFAKAVNCRTWQKQKFGEPCGKCTSCMAVSDGSHLDLVEIDAASNRGIEQIRDLREKIKLSPVLGRFKVYIIDEAQMLTTEAFNALLKTLEEPPAHAIFILCTTAAGKLPLTIISRLARFNFSRAKDDEIVLALSKIAKSEGLSVEADAYGLIAKVADGSFRDAVSLLDQLAVKGKKIKHADAILIGGVSGTGQIMEFLQLLAAGDLKAAILFVEKFAKSGGDISIFIRELVLQLEVVLLLKVGARGEVAGDVDAGQLKDLEDLSGKISFSQLSNYMKYLLVAESEIKIYPLPKIPLVLAVCKIIGEPVEKSADEPVSEAVSLPVAGKNNKGAQRAGAGHNLSRRARSKVKSLSDIEAKWGEFLEKVRSVNVHLVAILRSTRPTDISGDILTVEVFYSFHKDKLEESKIVKMLEEFLEEIFKTRVGLKFVLAQRQKVMPKAVKESDLIDVSGEDLSKIAAEIFSK